jgi:hypothetical protein
VQEGSHQCGAVELPRVLQARALGQEEVLDHVVSRSSDIEGADESRSEVDRDILVEFTVGVVLYTVRVSHVSMEGSTVTVS